MKEKNCVRLEEFDYLIDFNKNYILDFVMQNLPYKDCKTHLKEFNIPKEDYKKMCQDFQQIRQTITQKVTQTLR